MYCNTQHIHEQMLKVVLMDSGKQNKGFQVVHQIQRYNKVTVCKHPKTENQLDHKFVYKKWDSWFQFANAPLLVGRGDY